VTFVDEGVFTPYSTIQPLLGGDDDPALWAPELERQRIQAYQKYEEIYWSHTDAFRMVTRGDEENPIYVPNPRTIVDTTAYFLLKGVHIHLHVGEGGEESEIHRLLHEFKDRERFISKFHEAKHSGVVRGDYLLHMTADPLKPEGTRISINSVDPASFFPEFDDDNLDRVLAVNLVERFVDDEDQTKSYVKWLRYEYASRKTKDPRLAFSDPERVVLSQEGIWEVDGWWKGEDRRRLKEIRPLKALPPPIRTIPVYHFKNIPWQGQPFGSSELRGYELVQAGINQGISDEGLALALEGLGVYATDSGPPVDADGKPVDWSISPARVLELSSGTDFKRVQGIVSVKPWQDHLKFLVDSQYEATGTFRGGAIEAQVAESGIALAIKFLPTEAKLGERDEHGTSVLRQWTHDWLEWMQAYERQAIPENLRTEIILEDKLPTNKTDLLNLMNNLADRKAISLKFYREKLGEIYDMVFPDDIEEQIEAEAKAAMQAAVERAAQITEASGGPSENGNRSNNRNRPNESAGTEATQSTEEQTRV
jgi:hypothetical protein